MNYYLQGGENPRRFALVLSGTRIKSEDVEQALKMYLVDGHDMKFICDYVPIDRSNFNRALKAYNDQLTVIEKVKEIDWQNHKRG